MSSSTCNTAPATGPPPLLIPSLPDDVAVNCLARIPRSHHPTVSLVSKPIRSLLSSPLLYTARALLHSTEHLLYLSLRHHEHRSIQFFTLTQNSRKPHLLVPLPPIPSTSIGSAYATLGPKIYVLGGSINDVSSAHVWVLDCRFNRWEPGPKMRVPREFAAAGVVDGKIYIMGGCTVDTWARAANWAEVFDPAVGNWQTVSSPTEIREKWMHASAVVEGKIYAMADRGGLAYDPRSGVWESANSELDMGWRGRAAVVDGVLYCYDYLGKIRGFDVEEGLWKELKGLEKGLPRFLCGATMANVGGKLVVVWEVKMSGKELEIWCAEIEIEKRNGELWGKISWSDAVFSVSNGSSIVHCSAVTL